MKQGTTLYLCLENSQLRIQNRLFDVTEDAPSNVHFSTESRILGDGLTEQLVVTGGNVAALQNLDSVPSRIAP